VVLFRGSVNSTLWASHEGGRGLSSQGYLLEELKYEHLLRQLLGKADQMLSEGNAAEAESLCCQVLNGALTLHNPALAAEAAELSRRWRRRTPTLPVGPS